MEKLIAKQAAYERLRKAEEELTAKEKYQRSLARLEEIGLEENELMTYVSKYKEANKLK